jgi:hypothetical protein
LSCCLWCDVLCDADFATTLLVVMRAFPVFSSDLKLNLVRFHRRPRREVFLNAPKRLPIVSEIDF